MVCFNLFLCEIIHKFDLIVQKNITIFFKKNFTLYLFKTLVALYFMNIIVLPACMYVQHMSDWHLQRPEEDIRYPGTVVIEGWRPPWE